MSLEISDDELSFAFGLDNWQPFVEQVSTHLCTWWALPQGNCTEARLFCDQLAVYTAGMLSCQSRLTSCDHKLLS